MQQLLLESKTIPRICSCFNFEMICEFVLDICSVYSERHDVVYNVQKSGSMVTNSAKFKLTNLPRVYLAGVLLEYVERYKYLGMIIHIRHDDYDIQCVTVLV